MKIFGGLFPNNVLVVTYWLLCTANELQDKNYWHRQFDGLGQSTAKVIYCQSFVLYIIIFYNMYVREYTYVCQVTSKKSGGLFSDGTESDEDGLFSTKPTTTAAPKTTVSHFTYLGD